MGPTLVRLATPSDAGTLASIQVRGWRAAYEGLMPQSVLDGLSVEGRTAVWTHVITAPKSPDERNWIIENGGKAVGFASTGPSRDEGAAVSTKEVYALYLDPDYVGRGLGTALYTHAVADLESRGGRTVTLWALDGNVRAERFYERMAMRRDEAKMETVSGVALRHVRYVASI